MFAQFCITRLVKIILPALLPQKLDSNFALNCTFVVKDYNDRGQMYCNIFTYLFWPLDDSLTIVLPYICFSPLTCPLRGRWWLECSLFDSLMICLLDGSDCPFETLICPFDRLVCPFDRLVFPLHTLEAPLLITLSAEWPLSICCFDNSSPFWPLLCCWKTTLWCPLEGMLARLTS